MHAIAKRVARLLHGDASSALVVATLAPPLAGVVAALGGRQAVELGLASIGFLVGIVLAAALLAFLAREGRFPTKLGAGTMNVDLGTEAAVEAALELEQLRVDVDRVARTLAVLQTEMRGMPPADEGGAPDDAAGDPGGR